MIANVVTLTLAADFCQAVRRLRVRRDDVGDKSRQPARQYHRHVLDEHVFHRALAPLILVSAGATALVFLLVPLLRLGDKPQGEPA